jgi:hypothetical protein
MTGTIGQLFLPTYHACGHVHVHVHDGHDIPLLKTFIKNLYLKTKCAPLLLPKGNVPSCLFGLKLNLFYCYCGVTATSMVVGRFIKIAENI